MDQLFATRQMRGKYPENEKDVFLAFMDLENGYNTIDWHGMRQMLTVWSWRKMVESSAEILCR